MEIKEEGSFVVEDLRKYCSAVDFDAFEGEVSRQKYIASLRKSCYQYREPAHYIHNKTLKRHLGDANSFHGWCKLKESSTSDVTEMSSNSQVAENRQQSKAYSLIISYSTQYYKKIFGTAMVVAEEELAFRKLPGFIHHVEKQGVKFGSDDKITRKTCTEMIDIIAEVLLQTHRDSFVKAKCVSLTSDGSDAWKTGEGKQLVYGKVLLKRYQGFVLGNFFLACRSLKASGGPTADHTKEAMLQASYNVCEDMLETIMCLCAEGASVNFNIRDGRKVEPTASPLFTPMP